MVEGEKENSNDLIFMKLLNVRKKAMENYLYSYVQASGPEASTGLIRNHHVNEVLYAGYDPMEALHTQWLAASKKGKQIY